MSIQSETYLIAEGCIVGGVFGAIRSDEAIETYSKTYALRRGDTNVYAQLRIGKHLIDTTFDIVDIEHHSLLSREVSASCQRKEW